MINIHKIINESITRYLLSESFEFMRDDSKPFKLTLGWMYDMYDKFNSEIFGGVLPPCEMKIAPCTLGKKVLGEFGLEKGEGVIRVYAKTKSRKIYAQVKDRWDYYDVSIDRTNICTYCEPTITLSSLYVFNEYGASIVLLHEMCHYRVVYNGFYPRQSHGPEFRNVCSHVSYMTNGSINIERLLNAESVGIEDSDELKQYKARKEESVLRRLNYHVVIVNGGKEILFLNISGNNVLQDIVRYYKTTGSKIRILNIVNNELKDKLYNAGYKKFQRTFRYWNVLESKVLKEILYNELNNENNFRVVYGN